MPEADRSLGIKSFVVRPSVHERIGHFFKNTLGDRFQGPEVIDPG